MANLLKRKISYKLSEIKAFFLSFRMPKWFDYKIFKIGIIMVLVLLIGGYVMKTSSTAVSGYEIHDLEEQVSGLEKEISKLEIELADYSSLQNIEARLASTDMVEVSKISYVIGNRDSLVAINK